MSKINRTLTFFLALLFILNTGVAFASNADYEMGYEAGLSDGAANKDSDITASAALRTHKESEDYPGAEELDNAGDYDEGYFEGYADGLKEEVKINYADALGKSLGGIYGARDFQKDVKPDWEDSIPSDREIRRMYNLDKQDSEYREAFIATFTVAFELEYNASYEKAMLEPARTSLSQGITDGKKLGQLLGEAFGAKDYYEDEDLDYTRDLPSDRIINTEYALGNDNDEYKEGFLSGFISAYEIAYNKAFREANLNDTTRDEDDAISNGQEIGKKSGEIKATQDYMSNLTNDWRRSIPKDEFIITEYNLSLQSPNYRDGFISGYYDGYSEGYNAKYKELSQGAGVDKSVSEIIPLAGGSLMSLDNAMNISIEPGTYYHPVNLTINTTYDVGNMVTSSLVKSSDSYRVSILNTSGNLNNEKPIELAFEYYGDRLKGGIYKLSNGFWTFIDSEVKYEENRIVANIAPNTISAQGNVYAVFVDTGAKYFPDSRGHWAKDEIETLVRRNIIYGYPDGTFKPDRNVTRAEFLWLLSRMNRWNLPYYPVNDKLFTDFNSFGASAEVINYAFAEGYIKGYPDGTFRPNSNISYNEIQIIMGRVTGKFDFMWTDIATKILYEEKARSTSFNDMNNKITRAEIVYMLYNLTSTMY